MNYRLQLLLGAAITLLATTTQAQDMLEYGFSFHKAPEEKTPYVYYDMLRNQQPFFYTESRDNVNTENWEKIAMYVSDKPNDSTFSKLESHYWQAGNWLLSSKFAYTPSLIGNKYNNITTDADYANGTGVQRFVDAYTYNTQGYVATVERTRTTAPVGVISQMFYKYDGTGRVTEIATKYNSISDTFYRHYSYNGNAIFCTSEMAGDTSQTIQLLTDAAGRIAYKKSASYNGNVVESYMKEIYAYNATGKVDSFMAYYTDTDDTTTFMPAEKVENQYSTAGKLAGWVRSIGDGTTTGWRIDYKLVMGYDANNEADTARSYGYVAGTYANKHFYRFIFKKATSGIAQAVAANTEAITLYPNPATDIVRLNKKSGAVQNVKVYNEKGQMVLQTNGEVRELNISQLATGTYFLYADGASCNRFVKY